MCRQCTGFHVLCNYAFETLDLQPSYGEVVELRLLLPRACSANQTALSVMNRSFCSEYEGYELNLQDLEILNRFQTRTIPTLGTARSIPVYQSETFRLACLVGQTNLHKAETDITAAPGRYACYHGAGCQARSSQLSNAI